MKNCETFYEAQTASCLKEIIRPPPNPQLSPPHDSPPTHPTHTHTHTHKILLRLWNKHFLTEIYRNIQTFVFKVLQECSSLASRNGAAQMFFLLPNRNIFAGKLVKLERFLIVLREHIIFNVR